MRRAIYAFIGGLVVASCLVPDYEVDDSVDGTSGEGPGGESGTSTGGNVTGGSPTGGSSGRGGTSGQGGTSGRGGGAGQSGSSGQGGDPTTGGASGQAGDPTTGGTSGQGGASGAGGMPMGGTGGSAGAGTGGCLPGLTDCGGECFNLQTDGEHCGDCDTDCATGEVCLAGDCELDCGTLTQCGTSCVDTDTDEMHCGDCDTPCLGTCVGGNCDLSCPDNRLRCGAVCCALPPANGTASCVSNQCQFGCSAGHNSCSSNPLTCYAERDITHCGSNCLDCRQPNAVAACSVTNGVGTCPNTCVGTTLPCPPSSTGKPNCGTWDFESSTAEGWSIVRSDNGVGGVIPTAATGALTTRTTYKTTGNRSLAVHVETDGDQVFGVEFNLKLCGGGQPINIAGKQLKFDIIAITDMGTYPFELADSYSYFKLYNGTQSLVGTGDFGMASDDMWITPVLPIFSEVTALTDIIFWLRIFEPWTGWVYIDNVRIENP